MENTAYGLAMGLPIVEMNVNLNISSTYRRRIHDFPTQVSPTTISLNCMS